VHVWRCPCWCLLFPGMDCPDLQQFMMVLPKYWNIHLVFHVGRLLPYNSKQASASQVHCLLVPVSFRQGMLL